MKTYPLFVFNVLQIRKALQSFFENFVNITMFVMVLSYFQHKILLRR